MGTYSFDTFKTTIRPSISPDEHNPACGRRHVSNVRSTSRDALLSLQCDRDTVSWLWSLPQLPYMGANA
jgi:hypothetical protein